MKESGSVAEALRTFFERNTSGDISTFEDVVSIEAGVSAIGSTAREWFIGQEAARSA